MALSFTGLRNQFGQLSNNDSSANLTLGDTLINQRLRYIYALFPWPFLEKSATASTETDNAHDLPYDLEKIQMVTVTISNQIYTPREAPSVDFWNRLNVNSTVTSNIPQWFFVYNGSLKFWPAPSSATSNAITFYYRRRTPDLTRADYSTGNVSVATLASTSVTGSGTTWTVPMAGRFLKITPTDTAAASGDGNWYEIASVGSATALTLSKAYQGVTIGSNTAYVIGQLPLLPEEFHDLPVWGALEEYFTTIDPETTRAQLYGQRFKEGLARLVTAHGSRTDSPVIDSGDDLRSFVSPNLYPQNLA